MHPVTTRLTMACLLVCLAISTPYTVIASEAILKSDTIPMGDDTYQPEEIHFGPEIVIDGQYIPKEGNDSYIVNDRTMVKFRFVMNNLGATVEWLQASITATAQLKDKSVVAPVGSSVAWVNGEPFPLDSPVFLNTQEARVYVPLSFFAQAFGYRVEYYKNTVVVSSTPELEETGKKTVDTGNSFTHKLSRTLEVAATFAPDDKTREAIERQIAALRTFPNGGAGITEVWLVNAPDSAKVLGIGMGHNAVLFRDPESGYSILLSHNPNPIDAGDYKCNGILEIGVLDNNQRPYDIFGAAMGNNIAAAGLYYDHNGQPVGWAGDREGASAADGNGGGNIYSGQPAIFNPGKAELNNMIDKAVTLSANPGVWELIGNNCSDNAIDIVSAGLPWVGITGRGGIMEPSDWSPNLAIWHIRDEQKKRAKAS